MLSSPDRKALTERRQHLRRQRQYRIWRMLWQILACSGLLGGTMWVVTRPAWILQSAAQVSIVGNRIMPTATLQALLPLDYPQSLLTVQPQAIADRLEDQAAIAEVTVARHLLPPGLTVRVVERIPVAIVPPLPDAPPAATPPLAGVVDPSQSGLIDAQGVWMPWPDHPESEPTATETTLVWPTLTVQGLNAQNQAAWPTLYQAIQQSPVTITTIDWRQPTNLILITEELGAVHLGPYGEQFSAQLAALDQMRDLPNQLAHQPFAYVDLRNPATPRIQVPPSPAPAPRP